MLRSEKFEVVDNLKKIFSENSAVIVTHYHGLSMSQLTELRSKMYDDGMRFMITKNTLAKIAVKDTQLSGLESHFNGPTAIAIAKDPVGVTKVLTDFVKKNEELKLVAAVVDNQLLDVSGITALSKMPSLDELRAGIISLFSAPARSIASVLSAPAGQIARVTSAYSKKAS